MNIVVTQENFSRALSAVGRVANNKTQLPILNNILLRTSSNRLLVAATNLEIAITEHIGVKVKTEGAITVPARLVTEFVSNLPKGNVELKVEGTHLHVSSGAYTSTINGMPADEFPELPSIDTNIELDVDVDVLKKAVAQTVVTAANDATRPILTGVYIHSHDKKLYFAATDGYRLSERYIAPIEQEIAAVIPASTLQDVLRITPDGVTKATMPFDETQVRVRMDDIEVTSRLIEGKFPDYRELIPKSSDNVIRMEKSEFSRITKIASIFARESGGSVTLKTDESKKTLAIHSIASQLGENTSEASADIKGDGQVTLNSRYLLEALGTIDDDSIEFSFSGKLAPCVLRADKKDYDYQHIIMPLKS